MNLKKLNGSKYKSSWFNPRQGTYTEPDIINNTGIVTFNPPGEAMAGNDWVLILEEVAR